MWFRFCASTGAHPNQIPCHSKTLLGGQKLTCFKEQQPQIGHIISPSWSTTPSSCSKNQLFQGVWRRGCGTSEAATKPMDMIFIVAGILSHSSTRQLLGKLLAQV